MNGERVEQSPHDGAGTQRPPVASGEIARLEAEIERRRIELDVLHRLGKLGATARNEDELFGCATTIVAETLYPDNCGFLLLDAARGVLVTHPSFALSDPLVSCADKPLGTGITGQVALDGKTRCVQDVSRAEGYLAADPRTRSELCVPLKIGPQVVGVLNVESETLAAFKPADELLLTTVADIVGNALERLRAAEQVRRSERQFSLFMRHLPGLAWIKDEQGRYVYANDAAVKAFRTPRAELYGKTDEQVFPPATAIQFQAADRLALASGGEVRTIETLNDERGVLRQSIVSKFPLPSGDGQATHVGGVAIDITERIQAETALRESEEQYRGILESMPVGVFIHDGREMLYANPKSLHILGAQRLEDVRRRAPFDIVAPEFREAARRRVEEMLSGGQILPSIEAAVLRLDGTRVEVEVNSRPTRFAGRNCMQVLFHDITDRKRAKDTLQRVVDAIAPTTGQEFFSTLVRFLSEACQAKIVMAGAVDAQNLKYVETIAVVADGRPAENFHYDTTDTPCEHVIGHTMCYYPERVAQRFPNDKMLADLGIQSYLGIPLWTSDGRAAGLIAVLHDEPLADAEQKQVVLQVVAARCGAELERREAERKLRDSEARLQAVVRHAPNVAIQWYDAQGRVLLWNQASEAMYGFTAADAIGRSLDELMHDTEEMAAFRQMLAQAAAAGDPIGPREMSFRRRNGEAGVCLSSVFTIPGQDRGEWHVRMDIDVTERKRMQEDLSLRQRELLHASRLSVVGQMVAGLSHEVAQPLSAISNFAAATARLLEAAVAGQEEKPKQYVRAIVEQSRRCGAILQRLRDFTRRAPARQTPCELNPLLEDSVELIAPEAHRRGSEIRVEWGNDLPPILADRVQVQQVVFNLLNNALDAVRDQPRERRRITIRSRRDGDGVAFEVEDHGCGIPPDVAGRLFEPFLTTKPDGMGIGLNICEAIVRNHGGKIEGRGNAQGGATFSVRLPPCPDPVESP